MVVKLFAGITPAKQLLAIVIKFLVVASRITPPKFAGVELSATTVCLFATNDLDFLRALHQFAAAVTAHLDKDTG